mmetsp:Transcript_147171/g.472735  ORF Transcript_147171/g.472735 Transcript_147171/m.472735 type:complete len:242 (+) Transcript_147171:405-1130(+)
MSREGPASKAVPVSKAAWQPDRQSPRGVLPKARSRIATCQYPGCETGSHESGASNRSSRTSPNSTSPLGRPSPPSISSPPLSRSKKTENRPRLSKPAVIRESTKVNFCASANCGKASPRMPSKGASAKGSSLSLVAVMKLSRVQRSLRQTRSCSKTPVTSPVPKVTVTESRCRRPPAPLSDATSASAEAMGKEVEEALASKRLWLVQAAAAQLTDGTMMLPLPVSSTTRNTCSGVPMDMYP